MRGPNARTSHVGCLAHAAGGGTGGRSVPHLDDVLGAMDHWESGTVELKLIYSDSSTVVDSVNSSKTQI